MPRRKASKYMYSTAAECKQLLKSQVLTGYILDVHLAVGLDFSC